MQKQLVTQVHAYRESRSAGNITVLAIEDGYGNITGAVEQKTFHPIIGEQVVNVLAPVTIANLDTVIENVKKLIVEGDPNNPQEQGTKTIDEQIASYEKIIADMKAKRTKREKDFGEELANLEAMRDDVRLAIEAKEKERDARLGKQTEKSSEEAKTAKKTNA
jgi:hypothetical protein